MHASSLDEYKVKNKIILSNHIYVIYILSQT